ncbi:hypothetical protein [Puniceibacterium sp. IMCC21224]|uniref:hypothetical protein n=1 Tax=Puniceibacterium sp. IMCC21224 TaxID=1618204 RepID=UPI00065CD59F|nr:hypothetical protein [Puniceibacterium sp. IMCC21224]KMK67042.1 hypothetical protein IMCC21224_111905 [Puniceibacterium sp. IMCC21224]
MRITQLILWTTTAIITPALAFVDPVSAFVAGLSGAVAGAVGGLTAIGFTLGNFLGQTLLEGLLLNLGLAYLLRPEQQGPPKIERAQVNTRIADAPRYQLGGSVKVGGAAGSFAEYAADGAFWYSVIHGDAEMASEPQYYLDGIEVELADYGLTLTTDVVTASTEDLDLSSATAVIGGYTVEADDRVLVKDQTDPVENGIYTVSFVDDGMGGDDVVLSRAADMAAALVVGRGFAVDVDGDGSPFIESSARYHVTTDGVTVGTDAMAWEASEYESLEIGDVITNKFCFTEDKKEYTGSGEKRCAYRVYTVSPSSAQVYGDLPTAFTDAFPDLPADFLLAGVCYSIVRARAGSTEAKPLIYRWRGLIGIGEPAVQVYANFTRMYDPRNGAHDIDDPDTWTAGDGNPVILWAWWRTNVWGRNQPMTAINWTEVAARSDICDTTVLDRNGDPVPLYRCGIAVPDNQTRQEAEQEILKTMDAFVAYDDEGRAYAIPGYYETPTLEFSAARDIFTAKTQTVNDGEQPMDGVVVNYLSPGHGYTKQPCSPWNNPDFYDAAREPNYQFVDALGCQNHNQAVRLAKAIGGRVQAENRAALGTTIKGILAKRERAIDLAYDAVFTGPHEIVGPVEEDGDGMACAFAVVPLASDRWALNEGEEGAPPAPTPSLDIDDSLGAAASVVLSSEPITTDSGLAVRIRATFAAPARESYVYRFRYAPEGTYNYEYFLTDMDGLYAYSALLNDGATYDVQWQTVDGDRATAYSDITQITATANDTAPAALASASATAGGAGEIDTSWTTANDANQYAVRIYLSATADIGMATLAATIITPANTFRAYTETGLAAGTFYVWAVPVNGSLVEGTPNGPFGPITVT